MRNHFPISGTYAGRVERNRVKVGIDLYLPIDIPRWYGKPVEVRFYRGGYTVRLLED